MSNHSIYIKKFKEALLGDKNERKVGQFWFVRNPDPTIGGIETMTEEIYQLKKRSKQDKSIIPQLKKKQKEDERVLKTWQPDHITDEDLENIIG